MNCANNNMQKCKGALLSSLASLVRKIDCLYQCGTNIGVMLLITVPIRCKTHLEFWGEMHGSILRKMFSHCKNWPPAWLECCGNACSLRPEADASWDFGDLFVILSQAWSSSRSFPSIPIRDICLSPRKCFSLPDLGDSHWVPSDRIAFQPPPPSPWALAVLAPTGSSSFCSDLLGACQRPFMTGLERNTKAAFASNTLRNVKTSVGTHRLFVTSGTQCQLPSLASRVKWQNTMTCSIGLHRASQDRGYTLLKKVTLCLLPNWGNFLPFSILASIPDLCILTVLARAHLKKAIFK